MIIFGAGMAGLLAGNVLRKHKHLRIFESQPNLPNNHEAVFRHRDVNIFDATAIPFKKVTVRKGINYKGTFHTAPTPRLANLYAHKVTGKYQQRSIWNLDAATRYIAPTNFTSLLAQGLDIQYGAPLDATLLRDIDEPIISTIPMPTLMKLVEWDDMPVFSYRQVWTAVTYLSNCDLYQTVYYPNPELEMYRMSITGNKVMAEFISDPAELDCPIDEFVDHFLELDFGIKSDLHPLAVEIKTTKYGKINEIDEGVRNRFISHMTRNYSLYSLGRYATWRNILLDDVYHDIFSIQRLMKQNGED